jgi:metal-responsive CopG/Arc/MetJ family transcriptional regulator
MLATTPDQLRSEVDELIEKLGPGRSSLIPILQ